MDLATALQGLQQDAQRRQEYNEWLQKFQRTPEAWTVCAEALAADNDRGLKIFCAQTLRNKIVHDLRQLGPNKLPLKESLLNLLESNATLQPVCVQLCIALANLAMQTTEWQDPLHEMVEKLGNTHLLPCLLEFLKVLPEDFGTFGRRQRMERSRNLVTDNAPKVLNLLLEKAQFLSGHKGPFFEALLPWIPEVPVQDIVASPMLDWIFSALTSEDTISPAADCLCAIIHEADEVRDNLVRQTISVLLPKLLALREAAPHYEDNPELHRNMTLIFSRAAEDWHMLVIEDPGFRPLLDAVVECVAVPDSDLDVVEYTFAFLDKFELSVNTPKFAHLAPQFRTQFEVLQRSFTRYLQYRDFTSLQEQDNFKEFRYDIGDMLKICCVLLGPDLCLTISCNDLEQALNGPWQPTEALLFCIRTVARNVPVGNEVLRRVFEIIPKLPNNPKVTHAALLILGTYSEWANNHPDFIQFELEYITQGVNSANLDVRRAAAQSLLWFLTDCARHMVAYLPQLIQFYEPLADHLDSDSLVQVAEGIAAVVNELNGVHEAASALEQIFQAVASRGAAAMQEQAAATSDGSSVLEELGARFHGLSGFARVLRATGEADDNSAITLVVKHFHEPFMALFIYGAANAALEMGILRYYINAVKNCSVALTPQLPALINACSEVSQRHFYPLFASLYGMLAQSFNDSQESMAQFEVIDELFSFFEKSSQSMLGLIEASTRPYQLGSEFIESMFHFWCDCCMFYTTKFIFSDVFDRTITAATRALEFGDLPVLVSVANYFDDIKSSASATSSDNPMGEMQLGRVVSIIRKHGEKILYYVFIGYQYNYDRPFFPRANSIVDLVCQLSKPDCINWIQSVYNSLPDGSVSPEETMESLKQVIAVLATGGPGVGMIMQTYAEGYVERHIAPRS